MLVSWSLRRLFTGAALLTLLPFSGCLTGDTDLWAEAPLHGFFVQFEERSGNRSITATLDGPESILAADTEPRRAYRLFVQDERSTRTLWLDGAFRTMRSTTHGSYLDWGEPRDPHPHGLLWPATVLGRDDAPWAHREMSSETEDGVLKIRFAGSWYHYRGGEQVPFLIESVHAEGPVWDRVRYTENAALRPIEAWEPPPEQPRDGLLFPGADVPQFGHPRSFEELLDGLLGHSESTRDLIEAGGCVSRIQMNPTYTEPETTAAGVEVGEVTVHPVTIRIQARGEAPSSEDDLLHDALSPYPTQEGQEWLLTTRESELTGVETEYEFTRSGPIGYVSCAAIDGSPGAEPLDLAWERAQALPLGWDSAPPGFQWEIGHVGICCPPAAERYVFEKPPGTSSAHWVWVTAHGALLERAYQKGGLPELE